MGTRVVDSWKASLWEDLAYLGASVVKGRRDHLLLPVRAMNNVYARRQASSRPLFASPPTLR